MLNLSSCSIIMTLTALPLLFLLFGIQKGNYMWHIQSSKSSGLCHLAGFLCTTSLRMSLMLSLILTLERMASSIFPLNITAHFSQTVTAKATAVAMMLNPGLSSVDLLVYSDIVGTVEITSMCVPLMFQRYVSCPFA